MGGTRSPGPPSRRPTAPPHSPRASRRGTTLRQARRIALGNGLRYVYTGNVHDPDDGTTHCPSCGQAVVVRDWYVIERYRLTDDGRCTSCGTAVPGRYDGPVGRWGARRLPVSLARGGS